MNTNPGVGQQSMGDIAPKLIELTHLAFYVCRLGAASAVSALRALDTATAP